jgi:chorismate dehydratase
MYLTLTELSLYCVVENSVKEIMIGSVPYLNGKPLMRWFTDTSDGLASGVTVIEAVPSQLAGMLESGEIAAALVSSVELFRAPGLTYVPGIAVVAEGPVESVRLFSRVPLTEIRRVSLDASSLTSVALLKILLRELYDLTPNYISAKPDLDAMLADSDAALLIGDNGYREYDSSLHILDLGEGWKRLTGLPFVYACWIGRPESLTPALRESLLIARNWGKANLELIARTEHERLDESYERARHYLTEIMRYDMGEREETALHLFGDKVAEKANLTAKVSTS